MNDRVEKALSVLRRYKDGNYTYLGEGFSGVVFHDGFCVYKVHIPKANNRYGEMDGLLYTISKADVFRNSRHFYPIEVIKIDGTYVLKYPYEENEGVERIEEDEVISFLAEMWNKKIVCKSITKEKNFIRAKGVLKFIDYEILPYNDNLFLNTAARAYLYLKNPDKTEGEYNRLKRSIINNFTHPAIRGFPEFIRKVFTCITFPECLDNSKSQNDDENFKSIEDVNEKILWNAIGRGHFIESFDLDISCRSCEFNVRARPKQMKLRRMDKKVTLLIKACPQDSPTLYTQVRHIVHQLSSPDIFYEKVIAIDKKERDFLRQYTDEGSLEELYRVINRLIDEGIIDYYIELPDEEVEDVNDRWFGIRTKHTHTVDNIPVTPQVYAFEKVRGDYILQMDSDVLIGREDYSHSFLEDMIKALEENENAVSVGFNIYKEPSVKFTRYHAPPGGYKPEVRFALIHKFRLLNLRPLPNEVIDGKLKLGWYHALHELQKRSKVVSLRGGDRRSFYIHPQNYRKTCKYSWFVIMDRIEKGLIPEVQMEKFDLDGSFYDWAIPKRKEDIVLVSVIDRNTDLRKFFRFYESIRRQKTDKIGIILINTDPDYVKDKLIWAHLKDDINITYVHTKIEMPNTEAIYIAVHYFIPDLNTYVLLANPNDFFVGTDAISEIYERLRMYDGDALIGKPIGAHTLKDVGYFSVDFINTRDISSNLHHYPKVFKKILLERAGPYAFKKKVDAGGKFSNFERMSKKYSWFEDPENAYMFSLLVEISDNPIRFDFINYFVDRKINEVDIEKVYELLRMKKRPIQTKNIENGRIDFIPNLNKIEIDITYDCNLKCKSCNRSCTQAPSKDDYMTVEQIKKFIEESIELGKKWELINILGGEPTLHPDLLEIVRLIYEEYILKHSPNTILQITSNGYSQESRDILSKLPDSPNIVVDKRSFKTSNKIDYFTPFNLAPIDTQKYRESDFSKGCWVTSYCGIGLNKYGYYPCGVAGAMDRVMGYDIGIKSLKEVTVDKLKELLDVFCRYCGNFVDYADNYGDFMPRCEKRPFTKNMITKTWVGIYLNYHRKRPKLTPVYER